MREEEKQPKSGGSKLQRSLRKKWVFPAIYIASAAIILTGVLWFQSNSTNEARPAEDYTYEPEEKPGAYHQGNESVPVTFTEENFEWPVLDEESVFIQTPFYDENASEEDQEAALVFYNNTYYQNKGIDFAMEGDQGFDVVASLSGSVVKAEKDELLGYVVQIDHEDGLSTRYQSLENVNVEVGAQVDQGDVIGTAGRSVYNQDAGVHLHFEVRKDSEALNPISYFNKPVSSILEEPEENEETVGQEEEAEDNTEAGEEEEDQESEASEEESNGTSEEENQENSIEESSADNMTRA